MIPSGIAPIDERLGGLVAGRPYVLTGAPGTGKTVACLEFLHAALERGEPAAIVTHDDPTDLLAQGEFLGIDLERALDEDRLVLLRYQLDFARRFGRASSPDVAFEELTRLLGEVRPTRIVIDSVSPFLEAGMASGAGIRAMLQFLDRSGATSMLTYPADLAGLYDRRLEPLVQRAAAIFHFSVTADHAGVIDIRKVRYQVPSTAPISFRVAPGDGITSLGTHRRRADDLPEETRRKILVLDLSDGIPDELFQLLRGEFDVAVRTGVASAFSDLAASGTGAVLIDVRRDTIDDALTLVRELRRAGNRAPVILVTPYTLRSRDRARALRAGADDFVSGDLHPEELLTRIAAAVRHGPSSAQPVADAEVPLVTQAAADARPFDADAFARAVQGHIEGDRLPFFTLVRLTPRDGDTEALAALVLGAIRTDDGDLAGIVGGDVAVYLHSARRKDVPPFVERVRDGWRRAGHGELGVHTAAWPADESRVSALLQPAPAGA